MVKFFGYTTFILMNIMFIICVGQGLCSGEFAGIFLGVFMFSVGMLLNGLVYEAFWKKR